MMAAPRPRRSFEVYEVAAAPPFCAACAAPDPLTARGKARKELMTQLMPSDALSLQKLEAVIERGLRTFVEVGAALLEIREGRLYRATHVTFEEYCKERWGWNRDYANKQIRAAQVVQNLDTNVSKPQTEAQARVPSTAGTGRTA